LFLIVYLIHIVVYLYLTLYPRFHLVLTPIIWVQLKPLKWLIIKGNVQIKKQRNTPKNIGVNPFFLVMLIWANKPLDPHGTSHYIINTNFSIFKMISTYLKSSLLYYIYDISITYIEVIKVKLMYMIVQTKLSSISSYFNDHHTP